MAANMINNNNTMINEGETSWQANKRKRNEELNATTDVPFTTPIAEFPSGHLLRQQPPNFNRLPPSQTLPLLNLNAPPEDDHITQQNFMIADAPPEDDTQLNFLIADGPPEDDHINSLITRQNADVPPEDDHINSLITLQNFMIADASREDQNFMIDDEMNKMLEKKMLRELVIQINEFCHKLAAIPNAVRQGVLHGEGSSGSGTSHEEVNSSFRDPRQNDPAADTACRSCNLRPATMLWYPCRHLCVCSLCDNKVSICPICFCPKSSSARLNLPWL